MEDEERITMELEILAWDDVEDEWIALLLELAPVVGEA
jgi:hypothetical protein